MAKRATGTKLIGKPAGTPAAAPISPGAALETDNFAGALALINSLSGQRDGIEWEIKVYLSTGTGGRGNTTKPQFLFTAQLDDLPQLEERLAEMYAPIGGGDFRVIVRADNELVKNISLSIAPRPGWKPPPPSYMVPAHIETAAPAQSAADQVFLRLADMQEKSEARMVALIERVMNRPEVKQPTVLEQIQLMTEIQKLLPQGQQQNGMDMFDKGMKLAREMMEAAGAGGGGGGGTSWMDVVKAALESPIIKDMLAGAVAAGTAAAAVPALAAPVQIVSPQNPQAVAMMDTILKQAALKVEPATVAAQIAEHAPAAVMAELEAQEDIAGYIIQQFPAALQHRAWLEQVLAHLWEDEGSSPAVESPTLKNGPQAQAAAT